MKKSIALSLLIIGSISHADTITDWLDDVHKSPNLELSKLMVESVKAKSDSTSAALYPKLSLIGSIEHFNSPTSLRPVPPTEISQIGASGGGYPFVTTMTSFGATASMPLFVKALFTNIKKANENITLESIKQRITISQQDALLIGANAQLNYLENLDIALQAKELSLTSTKNNIQIETKNGRLAEIELVKINEQLNQTQLKRKETDNARIEVQKILTILTNHTIKHSVAMKLIKDQEDSQYLSVDAKTQELKIANLSTHAAQESLYPSLTLSGNYFHHSGDAYNNGDAISRDYGSIALTLSMPLYDKERLDTIELSRIEELKEQTSLSQAKLEAQNNYQALIKEYTNLKQSHLLAEKSVQNYEEMLKTARVAYISERMIQEEYLRYEDALLNAKASLYAIDAAIWQNIAQRAAINGKDFKEIVQ